MNIHNFMEDIVTKEVNSLYEQLKRDHITWLKCDCETCRLDTICYVLNRTTPKYSVSERGALHNVLDFKDDNQLKVDITSVALDGIRLINGSQRTYHKKPLNEEQIDDENTTYYNFPMIIGSVYDGNSFVPLSDVSITLKDDDKVIEMYDTTWQNPVKTYKSTQGTYSFWPKPVSCNDGSTQPKLFTLTLELKKDTFDTVSFAITIPIVPEAIRRSTLDSAFSLKVKDSFLFRKDVQNPME